MNVGENAVNQAAIAREQVNQQIKNHRELIAAARKQVQELVNMQVTVAKEEHRKLAEEAAREAERARIAAQEQTGNTSPDSQNQLVQLIKLLSKGTRVNEEEVAQQTIEVTEAASRVLDKVAQVFNTPSQESNSMENSLEPPPPSSQYH
ncbi:hypothetical protein [Aphanothece sacrum]|uniref:Chromosome segregation protein SMC n=1 Tax=Aphanothece sacrum FPU1 TaxID=1920663 RepID=A0A401ILF9_APHSA|nr:hypothetical protein [Aphanothece sacrum]GBF82093.1 chromosome segregation protein SMC [Aphanothece sacrum FPU1]GBF85027.1 chromosome segregation protein SMC [Aphanothece sacrum FPU3]